MKQQRGHRVSRVVHGPVEATVAPKNRVPRATLSRLFPRSCSRLSNDHASSRIRTTAMGAIDGCKMGIFKFSYKDYLLSGTQNKL